MINLDCLICSVTSSIIRIRNTLYKTESTKLHPVESITILNLKIFYNNFSLVRYNNSDSNKTKDNMIK